MPVIEALHQQTASAFGQGLALDVPGCGTKRSRDTNNLTLEAIASELVGDIVAAGMSDVVLVGHSQAGSIIPHMVAIRPELFRRVIYVTCSLPLPGQTVVAMIGSGVHGENPDEVGWPVDPRTHSMEERFSIMFCNDMEPAGRTEFMSKIGPDAWPLASYTHTEWRYDQVGTVPASYVICLRDMILPVSWQQKFVDRFDADRVIQIDAGHQAMITRPHALAEILRNEAA